MGKYGVSYRKPLPKVRNLSRELLAAATFEGVAEKSAFQIWISEIAVWAAAVSVMDIHQHVALTPLTDTSHLRRSAASARL